MKKNNYIIALILLAIAIIFTILVAKVDVRPVGPINPETSTVSEVGFATINSAISNKLGFNEICYKISKYIGYLTFVFIGLYGIIGIKELIKKKNLKEVNKTIYAIAMFYVCVAIVYTLFELLTINYRPLVMDNELEASYPSSHTILALCVCGSSIIAGKYVIKNKKITKLLNLLAWSMMIIVAVARFLSGVHWFTDIIGGIIISIFLLYTFASIIKAIANKNKEE